MENGLIISIKRVILIPSKFTSKFTKKDLGRVVTAKMPKTRINTGLLAHFRVEKRSKYMKATGIVRRIDE